MPNVQHEQALGEAREVKVSETQTATIGATETHAESPTTTEWSHPAELRRDILLDHSGTGIRS